MSKNKNAHAGESRKVEENAEFLYTVTDFAAEVGISNMSVLYWVSKGEFDPPAYVCGRKRQRLWHVESIKKAKDVYERRLKRNLTGADSPHFKVDKADKHTVPEASRLVDDETVNVDERIARYCECGALYFDWDTHNKFAHRGKYSVVNSRG